MSSIRLHREHGLNPSVEHCCLCGTDMGLVLFGAAMKGEAPRAVNMGHVCKRCKKVLDAGGVFIFEASGPDPKQRTGRMVAITHDAAVKIFKGDPKAQVVHVDKAVFDKLGFGEACKKNIGGDA